MGDVRAWPSAAPGSPAADTAGEPATEAGLLHLLMSSPFGRAQFQVPAAAIAAFLHRTYAIVQDGDESAFIDIDAELAELLSEP
jgi:hypothetical protein